mgnify:CR=1 FL=1
MLNPYKKVLEEYLQNTFNLQSFLIHFHFVTAYSTDESSDISFPIQKRLLALGDNEFLYGDDEDAISFSALPDATHIYYDTTAMDDVNTLPLMLKVEGDVFSVYLEDGWVKFTYPLSFTGINQSSVYHLRVYK